jgi:hypothetical protein
MYQTGDFFSNIDSLLDKARAPQKEDITRAFWRAEFTSNRSATNGWFLATLNFTMPSAFKAVTSKIKHTT